MEFKKQYCEAVAHQEIYITSELGFQFQAYNLHPKLVLFWII